MKKYETTAARSRNMAAIKPVGTKPEMIVRSLSHRLGFRFRLHAKDLPGKPDLVFRSRNKVIFVHGCFWHQHKKKSCKDGRMPKSRLHYWKPKLERNIQRDIQTRKSLAKLKWKTLVLWECDILGRPGWTKMQIVKFLNQLTPHRQTDHQTCSIQS
jgi:DNA mismatch endonuclease, patch repair protein